MKSTRKITIDSLKYDALLYNYIQFPRLIAEIAATQDINFDDLCESMNLERLEVYELFDRAEADWKKIKLKLLKGEL